MRPICAMALAAIVVLLGSPVGARAQTPQTTASVSVPRVINLTGIFQPVDGQPPRAVETVTLAIYAEPTGGVPLWQETQSVAVDARGRYALFLGATSAEGIPDAVLAAGAQWLGTRFDRPGEVEGPRLRFTSVPYTLRAADADTLGGRPASAYLLAPTSGTSGQGHTPTSTSVSGASASSTSASPAATTQAILTGTPNFVAKYATTTDVGPSALFENSGMVGLGTTTPFDLFHVRYTNTNGGLTGFAVQNLGNTTTSYSGMLFYDQNGALGQFQGFNNVTHEYRINNIAQTVGQFNGSINFMIGSTSRFLVTAPGNIGIGTTFPGSVLDVSNALIPTSGVADIAATTYTSGNLGSQIIGRTARGTAAAPSAVNNGDALARFLGSGYGATHFASSAGMTVLSAENWTDTAQGTSMNFTTTPTGTALPAVRMTLASNGNVGIGTSGPAASLEVSNATSNVAGNVNVIATSYAGTNVPGSVFLGRKARGTSAAPTAVQNNDILVAYGARGYGATNFGTGGGGIQFRATENWTDTAQGTAIDFRTTPNGTATLLPRMTITGDGNVGIGTTSPVHALEISANNTDPTLLATSYSTGQTAGIFFSRARGTSAAPSAVLVGDTLGFMGGNGYGTTGFGNVNAVVGMVAAENWTDTAHGTAIGFLTTPLGSTVTTLQMAVLPNGNIAVGTPLDVNGFPTAPDKITISGDARVGNATTNGCIKNFAGTGIVGTCASDRRYKKNITPFGPALDRLSALQPVHYFWRTTEFPEKHFGDAQAYGLIAQDVEQVLPELVVTNDDGYKAIDYSKLPLLTIQAVKELKAENDALKDRIAEIERLLKEMRATATPQ